MTVNNRCLRAGAVDLGSVRRNEAMQISSPMSTEAILYPGSKLKAKTAYKGREPLRFAFNCRGTDRDKVDATLATIMNAPKGTRFYSGRDDRFTLIDSAHGAPSGDIYAVRNGSPDYIYQGSCEVITQDPFFYSEAYDWADLSTYGEFGEIDNSGGDFDAPITALYLQCLVSAEGVKLGSPNLVLYETDHVTPISPAVQFVTQGHSDELIYFEPLRNKISQRYVDSIVDTNKWQRDKSDGTATFSSQMLTVASAGYLAYTFQSLWPINEVPTLRTRIVCSDVDDCGLYYQTERDDDWHAGPTIVNDTYTAYQFPAASGCKNFTLIFWATSTAMEIHGIDVALARHIADDDIPKVPAGAQASWSIVASAGYTLHAAGRFHPLFVRG